MRHRIDIAWLLATALALFAHPALATCTDPPPGSPTPPNPGIAKTCMVVDIAPAGLNQADIDAALADCVPGCNLYFPTGTYNDVAMNIGSFGDGFAMYGNGVGNTVLKAPIYDYLPTTFTHDYMIELTYDAPDGVIIENMTLDGRKSAQIDPATEGKACLYTLNGSCSSQAACDCPYPNGSPNGLCFRTLSGLVAGIYTGNPNAEIHHGGQVRGVEFKEFLGFGLQLRQSHDWTVEYCTFDKLGCRNVAPAGGPSARCPLLQSICNVDGVPHRKTNGIALELGSQTDGILVQNNTVTNATKVGIATYSQTDPCDANNSNGHTIRDNTVAWSGTGIYINGGCNTTIEDNTVSRSIMPGHEATDGGAGFGCFSGGKGSVWRGNSSLNNQSAGFLMKCREQTAPDNDGQDDVVNLLLEDNSSYGNCQTTTQSILGDVQVGPAAYDDTSCVTITGHESNSPKCPAGLRIVDTDGVHVDGGSFSGGKDSGIWVRDASEVEIEGLTVINAPGNTGNVGIRLVPPEITDFYIQATTAFNGFSTVVEPTTEVCNANSVYYCAFEDSTDGDGSGQDAVCSPTVITPECCDNIAGGGGGCVFPTCAP